MSQNYFRISVVNGGVRLSVIDGAEQSVIFSEEDNNIPVPFLDFGTAQNSFNFASAIQHAIDKYSALPLTREVDDKLFSFDPNDD